MATDKKKATIWAKEDDDLAIRSDGEWTKRVNLDIPAWAIKELDREATRRGITRQALMKTWLIDKIDALKMRDIG